MIALLDIWSSQPLQSYTVDLFFPLPIVLGVAGIPHFGHIAIVMGRAGFEPAIYLVLMDNFICSQFIFNISMQK